MELLELQNRQSNVLTKNIISRLDDEMININRK